MQIPYCFGLSGILTFKISIICCEIKCFPTLQLLLLWDEFIKEYVLEYHILFLAKLRFPLFSPKGPEGTAVMKIGFFR